MAVDVGSNAIAQRANMKLSVSVLKPLIQSVFLLYFGLYKQSYLPEKEEMEKLLLSANI